MVLMGVGIIILLLICLVIISISIRKTKQQHKAFHLNKKHKEVNILPERRAQIEKAILRALDENNFEVYYQPVFSKFDELKAAEALVRLRDPECGEILPEEFIPIAIQMGKMNEIGLQVFEQVADFIHQNDMEALGLNYVEVNVSLAECLEPDLPQNLMAILEAHNVPKGMINLQISEEALVGMHADLLHNMHAMNEEGVNFSLDDYGSSSITLACIMTLPFQFVKIDKSVLWTAIENRSAMEAFRASINTLKDFSVKIVVEGVETREMAEHLKRLGCDYLQGFYYAKPLNVKDFKDFCLTMDKA